MSYKKMLPLVLAALLLWTVPASAAPETTLKVALGDPEDSEMGVVGHAFKKYVEEKTGGKVEVQARTFHLIEQFFQSTKFSLYTILIICLGGHTHQSTYPYMRIFLRGTAL